MPNIKSAIKRVSVSEKKAAANKSKKSAIRTTVKKAKADIANGENLDATIKSTQKALDQAAAKGHMSKNAASRTKSRLAKAANAAEIVGYAHSTAVLENNEFGGGVNAANHLDVRVVYRANNADNINANSDKIAVLPAGEYEFNAEVTALGLQLNNGESTLNANGNTLNLGNTNNYGVNVSGAETSLVINNADVNSLGGGLAATNGAYVEFNGKALYLNCASTSARYAIYAVGENSKVVVNGGDFSWNTAKNNKRAYVYCGAGATVEINGGTFAKPSTRSGYTAGFLGDGNIVVKGGTFAFNPSAWVAEGYQAVQDGANWVVSAI